MTSGPANLRDTAVSGRPLTDAEADLLDGAYAGDLERVKAALMDGADVNARHPGTGLCALHLAIAADSIDVLRYLVLDKGAAFFPDASGRWPTIVAGAAKASVEVADFILEQENRYCQTHGT